MACMPSIRSIQPTDVIAWLELRCALWPDESRDVHVAEINQFLEGNTPQAAAVLVAESADGAMIGFVELTLRPCAEGCHTTPVGYVEGWYVAPHARRTGVGRALVTAAEQWARAQGCRELASDTEVNNDRSTAAHLRLGFEDAGLVRCFRKSL